MKANQVAFLVVLAVLPIFQDTLFAHHGYAAYDMTTVQSLKATIVDFKLINPHSVVTFDVADSGGNLQHWYVEWGTVRAMKNDGVTVDSLKPGDEVTIYFHPAKGGKFGGVLVKVEFPDGRVLPWLPQKGVQARANPNP